jgi:hypothetical protein
MKVVLLNGPPRAGKDAIGSMLEMGIDRSRRFKFAEPITRYLFDEFDIHMEHVQKDVPHERLFGRTPREVAIAYSERMCKPLFGQDYFGKEAIGRIEAARVECLTQVAIFTDSGFVSEVLPLVERFKAENILVVRVHRLGKNFDGDSRSFWQPPVGVKELDFDNDQKSLRELTTKVQSDLIPEIKERLFL